MKKAAIALAFFLIAFHLKAQEHTWAFGFYGDVQVKSPDYSRVFGIQGKYDFTKYSAIQAQVYGRSGYVAVGADYLLSLFNKTSRNFNVFLGGGVSQDFYRYNELMVNQENVTPEKRENFTVLNAQAGVSYYFPDVNLSLYGGYKLKVDIKREEVEPNYLMLGVRYHLW